MKIDDKSTPQSAFEKGIAEITRRCVAAKLPTEISEGFIEDIMLVIDFPAGHAARRETVMSDVDVDALLAIQFEKYRFIEGYNAIADYASGTIEAAVRFPTGMNLRNVFRILFGKKFPFSTPEEKLVVENKDALVLEYQKGKSALTARLGPKSPDFAGFATAFFSSQKYPFTLQISGATFSNNSEALVLLEKIANALFFDIDLVLGVPLILEKERKKSRSRKRNSITGKQLSFPTTQHDGRPMLLYWYARMSKGVPLLEFLAFYQVVEFYYPMFSEKDSIQKLKIILKDPRFDVHNDGDLGKILRTVKPSTRGFGNELQQLQATIRACIDSKELRAFFVEDEGRQAFFESNYKNVTRQQIPLKNTGSDLFQETAQRLYEIRCRIVHTKETSEDLENEPLLPFSREAEQLHFDIELMEFVATKVLISASRKFAI